MKKIFAIIAMCACFTLNSDAQNNVRRDTIRVPRIYPNPTGYSVSSGVDAKTAAKNAKELRKAVAKAVRSVANTPLVKSCNGDYERHKKILEERNRKNK